MPIGTTGVNFGGGYYTFYSFDDSNAQNWVRIGGTPSTIIAVPNSPNPNTSIMHSSVCSFNELLYMYGGYDTSANVQINNLYSYNPFSNSWTTLAVSPSAGTNAGGLIPANGKIYAIGGCTGASGVATAASTNAIYEYDPMANTWITKNNMIDSFFNGYCVVNNVVYRFGGFDPSASATTNLSYSYNPISENWVSLANHPNSNGIFNLQPIHYGNKIWCCGGSDGSSFTPVTTCFVYDILTDTWSSFAPLPVAVRDYQGVVLNNTLYVISGVLTGGGTSNFIYSYKFETGRWTREILTTPFVLTGGTNQGAIGPEPVGLGGA